MCFNVDLLLKAKDHNGIIVGNDPVNFIDLWGLAPFYNRSSRPIVVGGGTGPGQGHEGPHIQVTVPPGGIVDVNHPAYDSNGNGPLMDVDSVDTNRDGVADPPSGIKDMYPLEFRGQYM